MALPPIHRTSLSAIAKETESVLEEISRRNIRTGRFNDYLTVLQDAARTLSTPMKRPWLGSEARDRLFYEAATQSRQLVDSFDVWKSEPAWLVEKKLRDVCSGSALPPKAPDSDHSRNTLAELACAALMHRQGFTCRLTDGAADVEATFGNMKPVAVEAKRPAHVKSLGENARRVRKQLKARLRDGAMYGLGVFASDRMLGLTDGDLVVAHESALRGILHERVGKLVLKLQSPKLRLAETADLGAILTSGAVFCRVPGFLVTISELAFFFTRPEGHPVSDELFAALRPTVHQENGIGPFPSQ